MREQVLASTTSMKVQVLVLKVEEQTNQKRR
jgi:hypothetical protein